MDPHELTYNLLEEMGVKEPDADLAQSLEDHIAAVIIEVLLRRAPEERLPEIKQKLDDESANLEELVAEIASQIPGLAQEIEEAVGREFEVLKSMMRK